LHVLSTPPAFVLSQNQTLQTKTPGQTRQNPNQNKPDLTSIKLAKKRHTPKHGGTQSAAQKQTTNKNHQTHY